MWRFHVNYSQANSFVTVLLSEEGRGHHKEGVDIVCAGRGRLRAEIYPRSRTINESSKLDNLMSVKE